MISRITFSAAVFAAIATVSLAYAADSHQQQQASAETPRSAASAVPAVVVMPVVEVTGRRSR